MSNQAENPRLGVGFQHSKPFDAGYISVSDIHELHFEQYGSTSGKLVLYLHGGPGGCTTVANTQYFDPKVYRVVLYDQRGAGKSRPQAELRDNNTQSLVADIEKLREHINIPKWDVIFGGSWGSTLALLYAQAHPQRVGNLILRGVCTVRQSEFEWSRGTSGASRIYPDAYEDFLGHLSPDEQRDPIQGYYKLLTSNDREVQIAASKNWNRWDLTIGSLEPGPEQFSKLDDDEWCLAHARLEAHYFANRAWLREGQVLQPENLAKITHIPLTIVQGRYDIICPPTTAWQLHKSWPGSRIFLIPGAGHSIAEPGIRNKLLQICNEHAQI